MTAGMNGHGSMTASSPFLWVAGIPRPDHGPGMAQLVCDACGAGWVGSDGESCWWCERSLALLQEAQARLVIQPPQIDLDDVRWTAMMQDWRGRMHRAVQAELITARQAENAWQRAKGLRAA